MLQHISSIRKSPVGAKRKLVIELLLKTRQALTAEQISEASCVDIYGNKDVFHRLRNNPKVHFDGMRLSYKPQHDLKGKEQLLVLTRKYPEGLTVCGCQGCISICNGRFAGDEIIEGDVYEPEVEENVEPEYLEEAEDLDDPDYEPETI